MISFRVYGLPKPQGSKRAFRLKTGRIVLTESSKGVKPWREVVAWEAREAYGTDTPLMSVPVALACVFIMPRPKSHYHTGKRVGELRENAPLFCDHKPDADKLLRSTMDAMTGIVYRDDSQIIPFGPKMYGEKPGVFIILRPALCVGDVETVLAQAITFMRGGVK